MAKDAFISYRHEDADAANRVCAALEARNVSCWIAPRDIGVGQEWPTAIVSGIQESRALVLLLSSSSKNAHQIAREAELADNKGLKIVTLRIEDVQPPTELLYFIGNIQWIDAFGSRFDEALACVAEVIQKAGPPIPNTSGIHRQPTVPPPVPVTPVAATPVRRTPSRKFPIWIYIALAALVVACFLAWTLTRHLSPSPSVNNESGAEGGGSTQTKAQAWDQYQRGKILAANNQTAEALNAYASAIQIDPTLANPYYARALIYREQKELPEALKDANSAIQYSPNYVLAHELRGTIYNEMGQYQDAIADFTWVINQTNGARAFDYRARAKSNRALGNTDAAAQDEATAKNAAKSPSKR